MTDIPVDPKTGVPLNPEDILKPGVVPNTDLNGIPLKIVKGGVILTLVIPLLGVGVGFLITADILSGLLVGFWTLVTARLVGWTIQWMVS